MITTRIQDGFNVVDFFALETYDNFDFILEGIKNNFYAVVLDIINGPESRICDLTIETFDFVLVNNPYGNCLRPKSRESERYLNEIMPKIEAIFK